MTTTRKQKQEDMTNILLETTPIYKDLIGLVLKYYLDPEPTKIEVGQEYDNSIPIQYRIDKTERYDKVIKKTRCYITIQHPQGNTSREKIRYYEDGSEYTESLKFDDLIN